MDEATPQGNGSHNGEKKHEKINGVFSTQVIQKVGTGTTVRKTVKKTYWMVDETETGEVEIQPLNVNYVPSGPKRKVSKDEFLEKFAPEPEFYINTVYPKMREMNMAVVTGEKHREKGENFSAELEFNHALTIDEENVRANFGLGLTYLERGDDSKANDIFQRLVKLEAAFEPEHKHLFNEFGINLRKNKMYEQSVEYYQRALGLSTVDENLHYNIARAWFEKQNYAKVKEHLDEAMRLNPNFEEGKKFLEYLAKKGLLSGAAGAKGKGGENGGAKPASSGPINVDL
jgi:tetratricopeptide (TPR) repeat protein